MRVLVVDDHPLFREGLISLVRAHGVEVVGEASDGREAVALTRKLRPDVVLMDLGMPGASGLEGTRLIKADLPEVKVMILTVSEAEADLFEAIRSGAHGYVVKSAPAVEFFEMLETVGRGEPGLSSGLAMKIVRHLALDEDRASPSVALTPRERDTLRLVADGKTNREIAEELAISEGTVKFHLTNILSKLHLQNRAQVVAYAHRRGLVRDAWEALGRHSSSPRS